MISIANSRYYFTRDKTCRQSISYTYKLIVQCYTIKHITIIESFVLFSESCWVPYCERTICSVERSALCQSETNLFQMFKTTRESAQVQHIKWSTLNWINKIHEIVFHLRKKYFVWRKQRMFYMSITIFYLLDAISISAEKARWCLSVARNAWGVKYNSLPETTRWKNYVRKNDRLINDNYQQSVKLNSSIIK